MDEMAFFLTNGGKFSGEEVYGALTPSSKGFSGDGKVICISSPYAKYGKFFEMYNAGMEEKDSKTLVFQMYTAMMNPDNISSDDLKTERRRNRNKFIAEFGAEFSDAVSAWIDDPNEFMECVDVSYPKPRKGKYDTRYYAGLDLGFKNDGTALSIVHDEDGVITLDYAKVWFSGSSDIWDFDTSIYSKCDTFKHLNVLKMEDIAEEIKEINRWFPIKKGIIDQHNGYGLMEMFEKQNIKYFSLENFNDTLNSEIYEITKRLYAEKLIRLFEDPVLIPELMMLEAEKIGSGKYKCDVRAPRRKGAHDDISESFARAVWLCYQDKRSAEGQKKIVSRPLGLPMQCNRLDTLMNRYRNGNNQRQLPINRRYF